MRLASGAWSAYLALASSVICLGFSALFVRWSGAPGPVMAFYRFFFATLILTPFGLRAFRGAQSAERAQPGRGWLGLALGALAGGALTGLDHVTWNTALAYTSAASATLLNNTAPFWVALAAWGLMGARPRPAFWGGLALALIGAALLTLGDPAALAAGGLRLGAGEAWALLSALFYAAYQLVTQRSRRRLPALAYAWLVGMVCTGFLAALCLGMGLSLSHYPAQSWLAFVGAALISQIGGVTGVIYALGRLPATVVSSTLVGQPVSTALLAAWLLGEALAPGQWLGLALAVVGILWVNLSARVAEG